MALGLTPNQPGLLSSTAGFCEGRLAPNSIYAVLHRKCRRLFPDAMFADLFAVKGRWSVPPMIVAVVMVLQRLEGLSDREAVDRFTFDTRWKYAAGGLDFDHPGFVHTVVVDFRARLAKSQRPDRIFDTVIEVARSAGLIGRKRVLDSTPIYDAVATQDTLTLVRSAIRQLLRAAGPVLRAELRAKAKTQPPTNTGGRFTMDAFDIDLDNDTVTCPNQQVAPIRRNSDGDGTANFGKACADCPLAAQCTTGKTGQPPRRRRQPRPAQRARHPLDRPRHLGCRSPMTRQQGRRPHPPRHPDPTEPLHGPPLPTKTGSRPRRPPSDSPAQTN